MYGKRCISLSPADLSLYVGLYKARTISVYSPCDGEKRFIHTIIAKSFITTVDTADSIVVELILRGHAVSHH